MQWTSILSSGGGNSPICFMLSGDLDKLVFVRACSRIFYRELFCFSSSIKKDNIRTPQSNMETVNKETLYGFLSIFVSFDIYIFHFHT